MINAKTVVLGTLATLGLALALPGCQTDNYATTWEDGTPVHSHPYQEWWSYQFVYFPGQQIYFEPYTETYFWFDNGLWEQGPEVPEPISLHSDKATVVKLQQKKPYVQHMTVSQWHPNYYGPFAGSCDAYHATTEAIAMSEQRAAVRLAATIEEIEQLQIGGASPFLENMSGDAGALESMSGESLDTMIEETSEMVTGVGTSSDDRQP